MRQNILHNIELILNQIWKIEKHVLLKGLIAFFVNFVGCLVLCSKTKYFMDQFFLSK